MGQNKIGHNKLKWNISIEKGNEIAHSIIKDILQQNKEPVPIIKSITKSRNVAGKRWYAKIFLLYILQMKAVERYLVKRLRNLNPNFRANIIEKRNALQAVARPCALGTHMLP